MADSTRKPTAGSAAFFQRSFLYPKFKALSEFIVYLPAATELGVSFQKRELMEITNIKNVPMYREKICTWHFKEWSYLYPNESFEDRAEKMVNYFDEHFIPSMFVAFDDNLLGTAAIIECDMETKKIFSPWVASVYVDKGKRRSGIGSKLIKHVMNVAKSKGIKKLYLFTPDMEKFYTSLGWVVESIENYHNEEVTVMSVNI